MKILLTDWAARQYSPAPSLFTLRRWARDGEIWPAPEKVGKFWMVEESAARLGSSSGVDLVQRLKSA